MILVTMKNAKRKREILQQMAALTAMERGKLSSYTFKNRSSSAGPYYKLQQWQNGKNVTRYVPAEAVPAVQAALAGYARFRQLTQQYSELVIAETRQQIRRLADSTR